MDSSIIAYEYLQANPNAVIEILTGFDHICAHLKGHGLTFSGRGSTVIEALASLDEDIQPVGISREAFSHPRPAPAPIDDQAHCRDCQTPVSRSCFYPGYGYLCWDCLKAHIGEELA